MRQCGKKCRNDAKNDERRAESDRSRMQPNTFHTRRLLFERSEKSNHPESEPGNRQSRSDPGEHRSI